MSYEASLRVVLQKRNKELFGRLLKIEQVARGLLSYTHGKFPYYTPHGFSHSLNVEENLNWIIPDQNKNGLNESEIFFLLVAAWMHDWGMIGQPDEKAEEIRLYHNSRTEENFGKLYEKLFLTEHEGRIIGRICRGHTKEDLHSKDFDDDILGSNIRIRIRFLAAILRIADELDLTYNRTPEVIYYSLNPHEKAKVEFENHLSIKGVGQLDEKHKVYISAVARDPRGAQALRAVAAKAQHELDSVKGILGQNGIPLDYIDLKLESRGFIDKPIGFEVDAKRIVQILMGEHLYKTPDVALRELVQNSIDSCRLGGQSEPETQFRITVRRPIEDIIEVEDNGIGMDYSAAKQFLSIIGASYFDSEGFKQLLKSKEFDPIARFGVGVLSCFLISNGIIVETKKKGFESCKFTINSTEQVWKYEKGSLKNPGTKFALRLNDKGRSINVKETLEKFFINPEVPIYYEDQDRKSRLYKTSWSLEKALQVSVRNSAETYRAPIRASEIFRFETQDYRVILGRVDGYYAGSLILFSHGIYVTDLLLSGLNQGRIVVCIDSLKNLFDLQISREAVVENSKWTSFIGDVFGCLFNRLAEKFMPEDPKLYLQMICTILERRFGFFLDESETMDSLLERRPILKAYLENVLFPIRSKGEIRFRSLVDISNQNDVIIYSVLSGEPFSEMKLVYDQIDKNKLVIFDPYRVEVHVRNQAGELIYRAKSVVTAILEQKMTKIPELQLFDILNTCCRPIDVDLGNITLKNIKWAKFPKGWRPLITICKKPVVDESASERFGSAYWANILLLSSLLDECSLESIGKIREICWYTEGVKLLSEPVIYLDREDKFFSKIFDLLVEKKPSRKLSLTISRYFKYLSFLPFALGDASSCLIFVDTLNILEKEIAEQLNIKKPQSILQRMGSIREIYLQCLQRGLESLFETRAGTQCGAYKSVPESSSNFSL